MGFSGWTLSSQQSPKDYGIGWAVRLAQMPLWLQACECPALVLLCSWLHPLLISPYLSTLYPPIKKLHFFFWSRTMHQPKVTGYRLYQARVWSKDIWLLEWGKIGTWTLFSKGEKAWWCQIGGGWKRKKDDGHPERDQERAKCRENNQRDILLSHVEEEIIEVKYFLLISMCL